MASRKETRFIDLMWKIRSEVTHNLEKQKVQYPRIFTGEMPIGELLRKFKEGELLANPLYVDNIAQHSGICAADLFIEPEHYSAAIHNSKISERSSKVSRLAHEIEQQVINNIVFSRDFNIEATLEGIKEQLEKI